MKKIIVRLALGVIFSVSGCVLGMNDNESVTLTKKFMNFTNTYLPIKQSLKNLQPHFDFLQTAQTTINAQHVPLFSNNMSAQEKAALIKAEKEQQKFIFDIFYHYQAIGKTFNKYQHAFSSCIVHKFEDTERENRRLTISKEQQDFITRKEKLAKEQKDNTSPLKKQSRRQQYKAIGITAAVTFGLTAVGMGTLFYLYPDHFPHRALTQTPL
jgi:hypothetical protein